VLFISNGPGGAPHNPALGRVLSEADLKMARIADEGFAVMMLLGQWPHSKNRDIRWRIRLLQTPQKLSLIDKTRNQ
jgi:hypothetical protein